MFVCVNELMLAVCSIAESATSLLANPTSLFMQAAGGVGGAVEDSAGQVAKDAGPAAKRTKEVGHSVADDTAEGAEGARGKAKGKASELKGQVAARCLLLHT